MKGLVLISFAGTGITAAAGTVIDIPEGVDWVKAGLVRVIEDEPEPATTPKPKRKKAGDS